MPSSYSTFWPFLSLLSSLGHPPGLLLLSLNHQQLIFHEAPGCPAAFILGHTLKVTYHQIGIIVFIFQGLFQRASSSFGSKISWRWVIFISFYSILGFLAGILLKVCPNCKDSLVKTGNKICKSIMVQINLILSQSKANGSGHHLNPLCIHFPLRTSIIFSICVIWLYGIWSKQGQGLRYYLKY